MWGVQFDGAYTGSYTLEFRYDDTLLGSKLDQMRLLHFEGGRWVAYPYTVLGGNRARVSNLTFNLATRQWFSLAVMPRTTLLRIE